MGIKENILERIKNEKIIPISRHKIIQKYFWIGLFFTLLLGLGVFLVSFFISDALEIVELMEMRTILLIGIWTLLIIVIGILAYVDLKDIGRVYRYGVFNVLLVIFTILLLGGGVIYFTGFGKDIQSFLMRHTPYEKLMLVYANWNNPSAGRLIGEIIKIKRGSVYVRNLDNQIWKVRISKDLFEQQDNEGEFLFEEGNTIKFTGQISGNLEFTADTAAMIFE